MQTGSSDEAFDRDLFVQLCRSRGWDRDAERARALKVSQSTIHRLQSGEQRPALKFANECRRVFGLENFVKLFPLPTSKEPSDVNS
jgi:transcriptional regulator with XRE-family HTH domain